MKAQDDAKMWTDLFTAERNNFRQLEKAFEQSSKKGTFVSIFDDRLVIDARNGGQWIVNRENGLATYASPAKRYPAKQTDLFKS